MSTCTPSLDLTMTFDLLVGSLHTEGLLCNMSTDFGDDSSSRFPFSARTHRQTDEVWLAQLVILTTPLLPPATTQSRYKGEIRKKGNIAEELGEMKQRVKDHSVIESRSRFTVKPLSDSLGKRHGLLAVNNVICGKRTTATSQGGFRGIRNRGFVVNPQNRISPTDRTRRYSQLYRSVLSCCSHGLTDEHAAVGVVGDGEEMRRHLGSTFAAVLADDVRRVDRQTTVRVDDDAEQTRVRLHVQHTHLPIATPRLSR